MNTVSSQLINCTTTTAFLLLALHFRNQSKALFVLFAIAVFASMTIEFIGVYKAKKYSEFVTPTRFAFFRFAISTFCYTEWLGDKSFYLKTMFGTLIISFAIMLLGMSNHKSESSH